MLLNDRVALVIGSDSGIGRATAVTVVPGSPCQVVTSLQYRAPPTRGGGKALGSGFALWSRPVTSVTRGGP
jgi:NAD(P)-dependent dehydrogenase (short-subunit alcohol dehydrogenase family)